MLMELVYSYLDLWGTFSDKYLDALIEISAHPACFYLINLVVFVVIIVVNNFFTGREGGPKRGGQESEGQGVTPRKVDLTTSACDHKITSFQDDVPMKEIFYVLRNDEGQGQ